MLYKAPGVYVQELKGASFITAVGTSTPGFIGIAPNIEANLNKAVAISNWTEFYKAFVQKPMPGQLEGEIKADTESGRTTVPVPPTKDQAYAPKTTDLAQAVKGFFDNGGSLCWVVNIGEGGELVGNDPTKRTGLSLFEPIEEISIVAAPGYSDPKHYNALITYCERRKSCIAILDPPKEVKDIRLLTETGTTAAGKENLKGNEKVSSLNTPTPAETGLRPRTSDLGYAAFYFPWLVAPDVFNPNKLIKVPPSGHIAGIYAMTDAKYGVQKAPANEVIAGITDVAYQVTSVEQETLNPMGINCIRSFSGDIRVWGARTLARESSEWRYLSVRRLFIMLAQSILKGTANFVFEPNDEALWKRIRATVITFLRGLHAQNAFMGSEKEAFFVKCDRETNPPEVVDAGEVVIMIGVAPLKPAEFVIFKIGQREGGSQITED